MTCGIQWGSGVSRRLPYNVAREYSNPIQVSIIKKRVTTYRAYVTSEDIETAFTAGILIFNTITLHK